MASRLASEGTPGLEEEVVVARPNTVFEKGQAVQVLWYEGTEEEAWIGGTIVKSKVAN